MGHAGTTRGRATDSAVAGNWHRPWTRPSQTSFRYFERWLRCATFGARAVRSWSRRVTETACNGAQQARGCDVVRRAQAFDDAVVLASAVGAGTGGVAASRYGRRRAEHLSGNLDGSRGAVAFVGVDRFPGVGSLCDGVSALVGRHAPIALDASGHLRQESAHRGVDDISLSRPSTPGLRSRAGAAGGSCSRISRVTRLRRVRRSRALRSPGRAPNSQRGAVRLAVWNPDLCRLDAKLRPPLSRTASTPPRHPPSSVSSARSTAARTSPASPGYSETSSTSESSPGPLAPDPRSGRLDG